MNGLHNIKSLTLNELKTWLKSVGEKPFRAEQIQNWLFRNQVENIEEMVNISPSPIQNERGVLYSFLN